MKSHQYTQIGSNFENANGEDNFERRPSSLGLRSKVIVIFPWLLAGICGTFAAALWTKFPCISALGCYESGFKTDFRNFGNQQQVPLEKVRFTSNLFFPHNYTPEYKPFGGPNRIDNMPYAGKPNPEMDENWELLIGNRYFEISEEEATEAWGDDRFQYLRDGSGYTAGFDVFHALHCLDYLRRGFEPDYYSRRGDFEYHKDHCIDIIRQYIQCCSSTTLVPVMYMEGSGNSAIDSDQIHTCRSFSFVREFATKASLGNRI